MSKNVEYCRKVQKNLRIGSDVSIGGSIGRVTAISHDFTTISVDFYNKYISSGDYSIDSVKLHSHHRENLYTKLTGKRISDKNLVDFCVGLQQLEPLIKYGRFIENYYLRNRSKKETARKLRISVDEVKQLKKDFIMAVREHNYDMLILSGLPISLDAPIECRIDNPVTLSRLKERKVFTLGDIKKLDGDDIGIVKVLWEELNNK